MAKDTAPKKDPRRKKALFAKSAKTGRFVSEEEADQSPETTYRSKQRTQK